MNHSWHTTFSLGSHTYSDNTGIVDIPPLTPQPESAPGRQERHRTLRHVTTPGTGEGSSDSRIVADLRMSESRAVDTDTTATTSWPPPVSHPSVVRHKTTFILLNTECGDIFIFLFEPLDRTGISIICFYFMFLKIKKVFVVTILIMMTTEDRTNTGLFMISWQFVWQLRNWWHFWSIVINIDPGVTLVLWLSQCFLSYW